MSTVNAPIVKKKRIWPYITVAGLITGGSLAVWIANKKKFGDSVVITQKIDTKVIEKRSVLFVKIPWIFQLIVTPTIKNPSNTSATLSQPYVELRLNESDAAPLSASQVTTTTKTIKAMSEITFDPIVLQINTSDILSNAKALLTNAIKDRKLGLYTKTIVYLVTAAAKLPVVKNDKTEITL